MLTGLSSQGGAETPNYEDVDVLDALRHMTGGQGPEAYIDAVGLEAHGTTLDAWYDRAKTSMLLATDRPHALRQAIIACRKGLNPARSTHPSSSRTVSVWKKRRRCAAHLVTNTTRAST
jgi:threonine dehydrogenase-like Zn-dependent dehydrogenase